MKIHKKHAWGVVAALVIAGIFFYGGMIYGQSVSQTTRNSASAGGQYQGMRPGTRTLGGGLTAGQIIAKDATSITVQMQNGSTKIVLVGSGMTVTKSVTGTVSDLSVGTNVAVTGTANADGSMTATMVQIRPQGQAPLETNVHSSSTGN